MTETPCTGHLTTPTYQPDTSTAHSSQSAAPAPNHPSDHTAEANAKTAKGTAMSDFDQILKEIDLMQEQILAISQLLNITHAIPQAPETTEPSEGSEPSA